MVFGTPVADFLLRWTLILALITIIILSPFVIKLALLINTTVTFFAVQRYVKWLFSQDFSALLSRSP
jgi:hypothetical protein